MVVHPTDRGLVHPSKKKWTTCPHKNPIDITRVAWFSMWSVRDIPRVLLSEDVRRCRIHPHAGHAGQSKIFWSLKSKMLLKDLNSLVKSDFARGEIPILSISLQWNHHFPLVKSWEIHHLLVKIPTLCVSPPRLGENTDSPTTSSRRPPGGEVRPPSIAKLTSLVSWWTFFGFMEDRT